jgi:hypothetical protein
MESDGGMIDELERIWKESIVTWTRYYISTCLEGLTKTVKNNSG